MSKQSTMMKASMKKLNDAMLSVGSSPYTEDELSPEMCAIFEKGISTIDFVDSNGRKEMRINHNQPPEKVIDGHFWVVKDGKVFQDTTGVKAYEQYLSRIREKWGDDITTAVPVYLPVDKVLGQTFFEHRLATILANVEQCGQSKREWEEDQDNCEMCAYQCFPNSVKVHRHHGGEIVFGHFGIMNSKNGEIFWLFGHPDNTPADYEQLKSSKSKNTRKTNISNHPELRYIQEQVDAKRKRMEEEAEKKTLAIAKKAVEDSKKAEVARQKAEDELFAMDEKDKKKEAGGGKTKKGGKK